MDDPDSSEPADAGTSGSGQTPAQGPPGNEDQDEHEGHFPMPSPWASAFAVLALLAFGVGLGVYVRPVSSSSPVMLAANPSGVASTSDTTTTSTATPPSSSPEATPSEESSGSSEEPSKAKEESTTESSSSSEEGAKGKEEAGGNASKGKEESQGKSTAGAGAKKESSTLPPIKHVFLIVLGEAGYEASFGTGSEAPYLAKTLRQQGELIGDYYGVASGQLANEIGLISGQGPTSQTATNCPVYEALSPGKPGSEGQALGNGCVYPISSLTIGDQLTAAGDTWKAYIQGLGEGSTGSSSCPAPAIGSAETDSSPTAANPYVTWRDPFLYFRSVIESSNCGQQNVGIGELTSNLKSTGETPSLSYIAPDPCEDGDAQQCSGSTTSGLAAAEGFLRKVVPEIESSPAYKEGGLIAIAADQAPQSGPHADSSGCCATPKYPNLPASSTTTTSASGLPSGGGRVGLLLISKYVKPGSSDVTGQYNHFSLLASIEGLFKLQTLGYAGNVQLPIFEKAVYNAYS